MGKNIPEFVPVARVVDVPEGTGIVVEAGQVQVAVFHVDGCFRAIGNMCPHRGGPLGAGEVNGGEVTCPWHAWRFDIRTGRCSTHPVARVVTYPVRVEDGEVQIDIGS